MALTCAIYLTNNTNGVYRAGQLVQGAVKYAIDESTEFTSVTLSLRGKGLCWWFTLFPGMGTMYTGSQDFVNQSIDLLQARKNETAVIAAGAYEKPFCFKLPDVSPSTFKDSRCFIAYFIELKFVKSNFMSFSKTHHLDIKVQDCIKPYLAQPMTYETKKEFFATKEAISLSAEIENMFLNAGDDINLNVNIKNQSDVAIITRRVELIEYITYKSNCNHQKQKSKTVNGLEVNLINNASLKDDYQFADKISTTPEMISIHSSIVTKEYRVKVTLRFPIPDRELCLEIPVVITKKIDDSEELKLNEQPPSYSQVMNETKEKHK